MPLIVGSNITSLNTQRHLMASGRAMGTAFERLSSGYRINSAADDAAGLAISNRLGSQIRSVNMAARNANDGISLVQTAEASMSEVSTILERMRELSVQAANDTNTLADRQSIQGEIDQLVAELDRIGDNTEYNTETLLDGSYSSREIHVGAQADQTISVSINDIRASALGAVATTTSTGDVDSNALATGDVSISGSLVEASVAADDTKSTTLNSASAIAKAAAINKSSGDHGVTATVEVNTYDTVATQAAVTSGDIAAGNLIINGVTVVASGVLGDDAGGHLTAAINSVAGSTGVSAEVLTTGFLQLTASDGRNVAVTLAGTAYTVSGLHSTTGSLVDLGRVKLTSNESFSLVGADASDRLGGLTPDSTVNVDQTDTVDTLSVVTQAEANSAMAVIDRAINQVSEWRGDLGSLQNRFESTVANLQAVSENLSAARSRIRDTDFATETANLTRAQIIQEAGVAMLAQANASPQMVLALLT